MHLDYTASGNCKAVIFSDRFGRGVRAYPCDEHLNSETFLNIVAFGLIPSVGIPSIMISDRGSNLISKLCKEFYREFGIDARQTDAHMHTGVALTERFNSSLREMARAAYFDNKAEWDLFLPYLVMAYNATIQGSTGYSPDFIEHGREKALPWHPMHASAVGEERTSTYVAKHLLGLHIAWSALEKNVAEAEQLRKQHSDSKYQTNVAFAPGDKVLILQPRLQDNGHALRWSVSRGEGTGRAGPLQASRPSRVAVR